MITFTMRSSSSRNENYKQFLITSGVEAMSLVLDAVMEVRASDVYHHTYHLMFCRTEPYACVEVSLSVNATHEEVDEVIGLAWEKLYSHRKPRSRENIRIPVAVVRTYWG